MQQAYEKAIKAYALMIWTGDAEDAEFRRLFLLAHSPLTRLSDVSTPTSRALYLLRREILAFVNGLDNKKLLLQIDATTPRTDPTEVSYRYPFLHGGSYLAPASYDGWDTYQGNLMGACAAVTRLIAAVKDERKTLTAR